MKTLTILAILLLATPVVAQDSEVKNERNNEKVVEIGKRLRAGISTGKISPEEAKKRFAQWRKSQADTRNDDSRKHTNDRVRSDSGNERDSRKYLEHSGRFRQGTKGADQRDYRVFRDDTGEVKRDRRGSKLDSKRHRTGARGQKLQHRPDAKQHRGFRRGNKGACGRCGERADKNRRGSRRFERSERKSFRSHWTDRKFRGPSTRIRTVR